MLLHVTFACSFLIQIVLVLGKVKVPFERFFINYFSNDKLKNDEEPSSGDDENGTISHNSSLIKKYLFS